MGIPQQNQVCLDLIVMPMEEFVENLRMVLGTLGYSILEPILKTSELSGVESSSAGGEKSNVLENLTFTVNNLVAKGAVTDEGFVLKKGSQLSKTNTDSISGNLANIKEKLISDNLLKDSGDCFIAVEDLLFNSSSYAAAIVAGTSRSGPQSWKTSEGKTLKSIEDEELKNA